jgi:hypothetical protein
MSWLGFSKRPTTGTHRAGPSLAVRWILQPIWPVALGKVKVPVTGSIEKVDTSADPK